MRTIKSNVTVSKLAEKYNVTSRQVFRWKAAGINIYEPRAVAEHLATTGKPSAETLAAIISQLTPKPRKAKV